MTTELIDALQKAVSSTAVTPAKTKSPLQPEFPVTTVPESETCPPPLQEPEGETLARAEPTEIEERSRAITAPRARFRDNNLGRVNLVRLTALIELVAVLCLFITTNKHFDVE